MHEEYLETWEVARMDDVGLKDIWRKQNWGTVLAVHFNFQACQFGDFLFWGFSMSSGIVMSVKFICILLLLRDFFIGLFIKLGLLNHCVKFTVHGRMKFQCRNSDQIHFSRCDKQVMTIFRETSSRKKEKTNKRRAFCKSNSPAQIIAVGIPTNPYPGRRSE